MYYPENDLSVEENLREEMLAPVETISKIEKFRVTTEFLTPQNLPRKKGKQIKVMFFPGKFGEFDIQRKLLVSSWNYRDIFRIVRFKKQSLVLEFFRGHPYMYKFASEPLRDLFICSLLEGCKRSKYVLSVSLVPSNPELKIGGRENYEPEVEEMMLKKLFDEKAPEKEKKKDKDKKKKKKIGDLKVLIDQVLMNVKMNGQGGMPGKVNKKLVSRVLIILLNIQSVFSENISFVDEKKKMYYKIDRPDLTEVVQAGLRLLILLLSVKKYYAVFATEILNGRFDKLLKSSLLVRDDPLLQFYALKAYRFGMDRVFPYKSENKEKAFKQKIFTDEFLNLLFDRCLRLYRGDPRRYGLPLFQFLSLMDLLVYSGLSSTHRSIYYRVIKKIGENLEKFDSFIYFCKSYGIVYSSAVLMKVYIMQLHQMANEGEKVMEKRELKEEEQKKQRLFADHQLQSLQNISFLIYFYLTLVQRDKYLLACLSDVIGLLCYKSKVNMKVLGKMFPNKEVMNIKRLIDEKKDEVKSGLSIEIVKKKEKEKDGNITPETPTSIPDKNDFKNIPHPSDTPKEKKEKGEDKKKVDKKKDKKKEAKEKKKKAASKTPKTPKTPKTTRTPRDKVKKDDIFLGEVHATKLYFAKSNRLNLTVLPKLKIDMTYWRTFIFQLKKWSHNLFLVWNIDTLKELSRKCRDEIVQFLKARDKYGVKMIWNYFEFKVCYDSLKKEPVVGGYFVRHVKDRDFKKRGLKIAKPTHFMEQLHHIIFFKDDDEYLRELCVKACTAVFDNFSEEIGHYVFMKELCLFMEDKLKLKRCQKTIHYETLIFLRSLFNVRKNMHLFIDCGGVELLMYYLNSIYEEPELQDTKTMIYDMKVDQNSMHVKVTSLVLDLMIQLAKFRPCMDEKLRRLIPVPQCIRTMCTIENLNRIVQVLLVPDEVIYQKVIELLMLLSYNDAILNRMYQTGFFFFVCLYRGKEFLNTLKLILKFHVRQIVSKEKMQEVYTGNKTDYTEYLPSCLHGLVPREFIYQILLVNKMTNPKLKKKRAKQLAKLAKIYTSEKYYSPVLVWSSEMKESMISQIKQQLNHFFTTIRESKYEGYKNSEILKKIYCTSEEYGGKQVICNFKELEEEFVCGHYYLRFFVHLGRWTKSFEREFRGDKAKIQGLLYSLTVCLKERPKVKKELGMCVKTLLILFQIERDLQIGLFDKYYKKLKYVMDFCNFVIFEQKNLSDRDIILIYQCLLFIDVIIRSSYQKVNYLKIVNFVMKIILQINQIVNVKKIEPLQQRTKRVNERKSRREKWETKVKPFDLSGLNIDERLYEILLLTNDYLFFLTDKFPKLVGVFEKRDSIVWNLFMDFLNNYPEEGCKEIKGKVLNLLPLLMQSTKIQKSMLMDGGLILYLLKFVNSPCVYTKLSTDILQRLVSALGMTKAAFSVPINKKVKIILKKVFPNKVEFATAEDRRNLKMMTEANKIFNSQMSKEMSKVLEDAIGSLVTSREPKKISFVELEFLESYGFECMKSEVRVQEVYLKLFNIFPKKRRKELITAEFIGGLLEHYRLYLGSMNENKLRITMESLYICSKYQESTPYFKVLETEEVFAKYLVGWCDWEKNYEIFTFILKFLTKLSVYMPSSFFLILIKYGFLPKFHKILRVRSPNRYFQQCQNMVAFILYHCLNKLQSNPEQDQHHFEVFVFSSLSVMLQAEDDNGMDEWYHKRVAILLSQILHRYPAIDKRVRLLFPDSNLYIDLFKTFPIIALQCFTKNKYQKPELYWSREALISLQRFIRSGLAKEQAEGIAEQIEKEKTVFSTLLRKPLPYRNIPVVHHGVFLKAYVFHPNYNFENFEVSKNFIHLMFRDCLKLLNTKNLDASDGPPPDSPAIEPHGNIFDKDPMKKSKSKSKAEGMRNRRVRYLIASILTYVGGKDHVIKKNIMNSMSVHPKTNKNVVHYLVDCMMKFRRFDNMEVGMKIMARLLSPSASRNYEDHLGKLCVFFDAFNNDAALIEMFYRYFISQMKQKKDENVELGLVVLIKLMLEYSGLSSKLMHTSKLIQLFLPYCEVDEEHVDSDEEEEEEEEDAPKKQVGKGAKYIRESIRNLMKQFFHVVDEQKPGVYSAINKEALSSKNKSIGKITVTKDVVDKSSFLNFRDRKLYRGHIVEFMNMVPKLDPMSLQNEETMLFNHKKFMNKAVRESHMFLESRKEKMFKHDSSKKKKRSDVPKKALPLPPAPAPPKSDQEQEDEEAVISDLSDMEEAEEEEEEEEEEKKDDVASGDVDEGGAEEDGEGEKEVLFEKQKKDGNMMEEKTGVGSKADGILFQLSSDEEDEDEEDVTQEELEKQLRKSDDIHSGDEALAGMSRGLTLKKKDDVAKEEDEEDVVDEKQAKEKKKEKRKSKRKSKKSKKVEEEESEGESSELSESSEEEGESESESESDGLDQLDISDVEKENIGDYSSKIDQEVDEEIKELKFTEEVDEVMKLFDEDDIFGDDPVEKEIALEPESLDLRNIKDAANPLNDNIENEEFDLNLNAMEDGPSDLEVKSLEDEVDSGLELEGGELDISSVLDDMIAKVDVDSSDDEKKD